MGCRPAAGTTRAGTVVLLLVLLAACGGGGEAPEEATPSPATGEAGDGAAATDPGSPPMPQLAVDRAEQPAPPMPPAGGTIQLRGVVESWPLLPGNRVRAALQLEIAPGFHVNANPPAEDWIIATEVRLEETPGITLARAWYPPAQAITFDFWPEPLDVWEGEAVVGLELRVADDAAAGERTARLVVRYQACNDEACFRPLEETLELPLVVASPGADVETVESPLLERAPFPREPQDAGRPVPDRDDGGPAGLSPGRAAAAGIIVASRPGAGPRRRG